MLYGLVSIKIVLLDILESNHGLVCRVCECFASGSFLAPTEALAPSASGAHYRHGLKTRAL